MISESLIDHPSGFLALSPRNHSFSVDGANGFISYREQGGHWIAFGGVHAPENNRAELLGAFLDAARRQRRRVLAVQVRAGQLPLFRQFGATLNQLGGSFSLELAGYSFAGTRKMKLRHKLKQAREAGLSVVELGRERPRDAAAFETLREISGRWLAAKKKKELDFMIGEIGAPQDTARRIFLALDAAGQPVGFITYVPAWGARPGYLHDLTRRLPDAPAGCMELCNAFALQRMREEGVAWLHFGFTPFIVDNDEPPEASRVMARLVRLLYRHGQMIYPAQSQAAYKLKWGVPSVEPEYVAGFPLSWRAVWDLLRLTRSL